VNGAAIDISDYGNYAITACSFDYNGLNGQGIPNNHGGTTCIVAVHIAAVAFTNCAFLNADVRILDNAVALISNTVIQGGRITTSNPTTYESYGFFNVGAGTSGPSLIQLFGVGLGIYDWPVVSGSDCGMALVGNSTVIDQASTATTIGLYGDNSGVPNSVGLRTNGGSKFLVTGTQPLVGATGIHGALADMILEDNGTAVQSLENGTPGVQCGTASLVGGITTVITAMITPTSRITVTVKDPSGGASPGNAILTVPSGSRTNGTPGTAAGAFAVTSLESGVPAATTSFDWVVTNDPPIQYPLLRWSDWLAPATPVSGFSKRAVCQGTGSTIAVTSAN